MPVIMGTPEGGPFAATSSEEWQVRILQNNVVTFRSRKAGAGQWTGERKAIVNPTSFKETIQAHYSLRPVLGLSHEVVQYVRTGTRKITMELWLSYHIFLQQGWLVETPDALLSWRNWFESLLVPSGVGLAPPKVAMLWPYADLWFMGVLESLDVDYERFDYRGAPIEMKLSISMIEVAEGLMLSDKVKQKGLGYGTYHPEAARLSRDVTDK